VIVRVKVARGQRLCFDDKVAVNKDGTVRRTNRKRLAVGRVVGPMFESGFVLVSMPPRVYSIV